MNDSLNEFYYWGTILVISTLIATFFRRLDYLILPGHHESIRNVLFKWWVFISDLKVIDLPRKMAKGFIFFEQYFFGNKIKSIRWFLRTFILSALLTSSAILIGEFVMHATRKYTVLEIVNSSAFWLFKHDLKFLIPINYILDTATITITYFILIYFCKNQNSFIRSIIIIMDILIAFFLGSICYTLGHYFEFGYLSLYVNISTYYNGLINFNSILDAYIGNFFFANTTFIPTSIYLSILFFLVVSLAAYRISNFILLYILQLAIETDKNIFFYTGTLLSLLTILISILIRILQLL